MFRSSTFGRQDKYFCMITKAQLSVLEAIIAFASGSFSSALLSRQTLFGSPLCYRVAAFPKPSGCHSWRPQSRAGSTFP